MPLARFDANCDPGNREDMRTTSKIKSLDIISLSLSLSRYLTHPSILCCVANVHQSGTLSGTGGRGSLVILLVLRELETGGAVCLPTCVREAQ